MTRAVEIRCLFEEEKVEEQNNNEVWNRDLAVFVPSLFVLRPPDHEDTRDDCVGDAEQELKPHRPLVESAHRLTGCFERDRCWKRSGCSPAPGVQVSPKAVSRSSSR
jgi:hypothetical protein